MAKKDKIGDYRAEFDKWLRDLSTYHTRFNNNYKKYTAYNETTQTRSRISDPVAPELVERVIQKLFERDPKFFAESRGKNLPREVKDVISGTAEFMWTNPDVVQNTGSMRNKLKALGRDFSVAGNTAVEVFWNNKADSPDMRIIPIEDVVFDPTKSLKTSPVYYVRQYVSLDYLKDNMEVKENGEVIRGIFKPAAIKKLDDTKSYKNDPENLVNRSGMANSPLVDRYELISRWEGKHCCRFIKGEEDDNNTIVQEFDNDVLGTHPLAFAMDIEVPKQPYAFSFVDFLSGLIRAKDMFLNQLVDYGSKVLNPPIFVDPSIAPVNLKTISNAYKLGGIVLAPPNQIEHKPMPSLGNFGFDMLNWIEGRAESVSGIGAYLAGVPNQASDKTQGTKGGIETLVSQSVSPVKDRQINIEESIIEPVINKWLKMVASTMGEDETKWVMLTGQSPQWIRVTKGLLQGKIKAVDLMTSGILSDEVEIQGLVNKMMEEGQDPEEDVLFDVDWIIRVETGSLAERDSEKEVAQKTMIANTAMQWGLPIDMSKLWQELALASGIKEPSQYLIQGGTNGNEPGAQPGSEEMGAPGQPTPPAQPDGAVQTMAGVGGGPVGQAVGMGPQGPM